MLGINSIQITQGLLRQISDIDGFKGLWAGLDKHSTGLHLLGDVADYGATFETLLGPLRDQPVSTQMIRVLHAAEMKKQNPDYSAAMSDYKGAASQLVIESSETVVGILETASSDQVERLLEKLCEWVNEELDKSEGIHPLIVIAIFTAVYLQISPFAEGNMRVVQFLIVVMLMKAGYVYAPYALLAPIMNDHGDAVFHALARNQQSLEDGRADWDDWLGCFMMLLQVQKDILYKRLYGKETELRNLPVLSSKVMELFKEHQRLQMKDIVKLTRGRRATLKLRLGELIDGGYLRRHGQGRGTWYSLV